MANAVGGFVTTALGDDAADTLPEVFDAVTVTARVEPTSAAAKLP